MERFSIALYINFRSREIRKSGGSAEDKGIGDYLFKYALYIDFPALAVEHGQRQHRENIKQRHYESREHGNQRDTLGTAQRLGKRYSYNGVVGAEDTLEHNALAFLVLNEQAHNYQAQRKNQQHRTDRKPHGTPVEGAKIADIVNGIEQQRRKSHAEHQLIAPLYEICVKKAYLLENVSQHYEHYYWHDRVYRVHEYIKHGSRHL